MTGDYKLVIKFASPEQMQAEIVKLLRIQAGNYSVDNRLAKRKKIKADLKSKSDGLEIAARFVERIGIV